MYSCPRGIGWRAAVQQKRSALATKSRNDGNATQGIDRPQRLHQCLADKVLTACGRSVDPMKPLDINVIVLPGLLGHKACGRFVGKAFADKHSAEGQRLLLVGSAREEKHRAKEQ